jgi:hypothetical protein
MKLEKYFKVVNATPKKTKLFVKKYLDNLDKINSPLNNNNGLPKT